VTSINAFTVDLEDWFHVTAFAEHIPHERWDDQTLRVDDSAGRLLDLLDRHSVKGTFFVLGWLAERRPGLVREVADRGHEIASHSYWHRLVYDLNPESFREDLQRASSAIFAACGVRPTMYRAPTFSIVERSMWALDALVAEGYTLDSSIFPVRHDRYGIPGFDRFPVELRRGSGTIIEFPLTTWKLLGTNVPSAGGGYLRHFPPAWIRRGIDHANRDGQPAVLYIHPWELDPDQPRVPVSWLQRRRHYGGLAATEQRLDRLLGAYPFGTVTAALKSRAQP